MTEAELKQSILARLGYPTVCNELQDQNWAEVFASATRWFNGKVGFIKRAPLQIAPGVGQYTLPDEVKDVMEVWFPGLDFMTSFSFDMPFYILWQLPHGWARSGQRFSGLVERLQYLETAQRILGGPAWEYESATHTLSIASPVSAEDASLLIYEYMAVGTGIADIQNPADIELYFQYSLAVTMMILGRIRSKYDVLPAAQGTVTLDGARLIEEATALLEKLDAQSFSRSKYSPIVIG